ncbi:MAG: SDR family oxidoreductase [Chloroflexi bacterium]|jgi:serine 3-dehydrogenase|uniref:NAD(P)-dependent oxidoreductase n=1 Tax=Candidatus Thermofonsia Clade 3 bacterium TaxID=2364212 RepID=A0A2M8QEW2_9CHLR|nr:SDR family oxidoreductase [Candidatus Roseilinea sp. NK_OTU-006]PJF48346.1 MAG: NAD(P)-dependent oxidoreductase [Candidatus Thermofonsia Clade 3 bacterium]RMG62275.1 MAG: SDR family oxidoreductase [Chloroflexota bacterium]
MSSISLQDRIVFITGASSGIGEACARAFAAQGAKLVLCARRYERLQKLAESLPVPTHIFKLDVTDRSAVEAAVAALPDGFREVDILINNAGLSRGLNKLQEGAIDDWEEMINTNIKGVLYVTRAILPGMIERQRGHIINLGSVAGHYAYQNGAVYCLSKAAIKSLTESLKQDLLGTPIRVSSVDPGLVETEFSVVRFHGDVERAKKVYEGVKPMTPEDVADAIVFCATRPPHVNINFIVMMAVGQSTPTTVYRQPIPGIS